MTKTATKTLIAALAAAVIGVASLSAPAMAAGQFSISYTPTDPDEAEVLGIGLEVFSLFNGLAASGANARQHGNHNSAGFNQQGSGNNGLIFQEGNGHHGTISQNGNNNSCGLFQFGKNTNGQCAQTGNNRSSITTVFGF